MNLILKHGKLLGFLVAAISIVVSLMSVKNHYIEVGYDRAVTEIQSSANDEITKATNQAIKNAKIETEKALNKQQGIFDSELKRVENERQVETIIKEVIRNVEVVKLENNCTDLGGDVKRLLNQAASPISASYNESSGGQGFSPSFSFD